VPIGKSDGALAQCVTALRRTSRHDKLHRHANLRSCIFPVEP